MDCSHFYHIALYTWTQRRILEARGKTPCEAWVLRPLWCRRLLHCLKPRPGLQQYSAGRRLFRYHCTSLETYMDSSCICCVKATLRRDVYIPITWQEHVLSQFYNWILLCKFQHKPSLSTTTMPYMTHLYGLGKQLTTSGDILHI